jgi:hypothetical protein
MLKPVRTPLNPHARQEHPVITRVSQTPAPAAETVRRADRDERITTCRYLRRAAQGQCTAEAVDPEGELLLCSKHLGEALELLRNAGLNLTGASL